MMGTIVENNNTAKPQTIDLKYGSISGGPEICIWFEPFATTFELSDGDYVILRTPRHTLESMEVLLGPGGLQVWVDHTVESLVLDRHGNEIARL